MKPIGKGKYLFILALIVLLAFLLRFYRLGINPPGLDWDEASLGWNAYSLLATGSDEYGNKLPVSFRSFNDYKPPVYIYAAIPGIALEGLNEFSVRFPSALAGVLAVIATFFLVRQWLALDNDTGGDKWQALPFLAAFLLAISPWSIQFSRGAFEANLALFLFIAGSVFLFRFVRLPSYFSLFFSIFFFILSLYCYHSSRLVVPLFLAGIAFYYRKIFFTHWKISLAGVIMAFILLYPLVRNTLHVGSVGARFGEVSIFSGPGPSDPPALAARYAKNYLDHLDFNFLFLNGDANFRHHAPNMGMLYLWELPFLLAGSYFLLARRPKWLFPLAWWFLLAPSAAAVTTETPHAIRALLYLPTYQIITGYGLIKTINLAKNFRLKVKSSVLSPTVWPRLSRGFAISSVCLMLLLNSFYYLHMYFVHLPVEYAPAWLYGYREVVKDVLATENNYDRIYVTSAYDQPYIYFLFYGRVSPVVKNNGYFYAGFDKYQFSLDRRDPGGLYILSPKDNASGLTVFKTINFPDGSPAFNFARME